jgi:hypothetical protein
MPLPLDVREPNKSDVIHIANALAAIADQVLRMQTGDTVDTDAVRTHRDTMRNIVNATSGVSPYRGED